MDPLMTFIAEEMAYFENLGTGINWGDISWLCNDWIPKRGGDKKNIITFTEITDNGRNSKLPLPYPYIDFVKATAVYLNRVKNAQYNSIQKYVIECRRLYKVLKCRLEDSPAVLTRWHFDEALKGIVESDYKNKYDAAASLQVVSELIDKKKITPTRLDFKHGLKVLSSRHTYIPLSELGSDTQRKDDEKLPSLEALKAYAICTNNPINSDEEILLRTLDLLIVMGQRGNEVALIPYDCWIEKEQKSRDGNVVLDSRNNPIIKIGIRYFGEKGAKDKVHWLADQDIPLAKRAVTRLKELTAGPRGIAQWQEENPGRLWEVDPDKIIDDDFILTKIAFACHYNLHLFLTRNGVNPIRFDYDKDRINESGPERYYRRNYYTAGKIESLILSKFFDGHVQLKLKNGDGWKIILSTCQLLSIRSLGAFQFKERGNFRIDLVPGPVTIKDINTALGAIRGLESIFERRKLIEADGSKIVLTSHQPRHWRNTLYELAGMSNVQQALAMGRQRLDQNPVYQHTSLLERTQSHRDYLAFKNPKEKMQFLQDGIREKKILGEITNLYHELKNNKGTKIADSFLKTHATAIHLTPYGGCTHDFSQAPCPKHLQCWNGCGHLHRTNTPGEAERIKELIGVSKISLENMKADAEDEFGADVWVNDLQSKIDNMQRALDIKPVDAPMKVFPQGKKFTIAFEERKESSV